MFTLEMYQQFFKPYIYAATRFFPFVEMVKICMSPCGFQVKAL